MVGDGDGAGGSVLVGDGDGAGDGGPGGAGGGAGDGWPGGAGGEDDAVGAAFKPMRAADIC